MAEPATSNDQPAGPQDGVVMTKEEWTTKYDALPEGAADVVEAALNLFEIWKKHDEQISVAVLTDAFDLAVDQGYDMAEIQLTMLMMAIRESGKRRRSS